MKPDTIINGKFLSAAMTGVHRVAFEIANALASLSEQNAPELRGRRFEVWHSHDGRDKAEAIRLPVREVGPLKGILWEQLTLPAWQGHSMLLNLCNLGPLASGNALTMIHDAQVLLSPKSYGLGFRLWYITLQRILARRNRALLTVSQYSREQIAKAGLAPADRIHVIHNGVDHVLRVPPDDAILERFSLAGTSYALGLATVQAHKNIGVLLKAFAKPELAGMKLVLFGSANHAAFTAAGHELPRNVVFAGHVTDGELRALMEHACALLFPSTTEGFGLPPLEAMLLGTPAVCAPCGALPEVCGDAALYADPHDAGAWAATLAGLASDSARQAALSVQGRTHASHFTWRNAALRLLDILDIVAVHRRAIADRFSEGLAHNVAACSPANDHVSLHQMLSGRRI
ncbi:glycosyltransferase family 4 protein [Novosphingobium album (ex Hu et al. 2023)]|uniref:Glycosyltransferase family 4 protein n=1 Tax=Novosphingobium album (ex Hu et al. 2023) TaxID=2930093 RepID=A0ABT0B403_9SPHN|nr:glycosyltransferase family 1 protein [Novosphingobium album (ex Hu et al. 2023)]MCJ2179787.1 glycosyltransferase family 4 protein [Novosphingobium album (ex Hu et al. 2023)]